MATEVSSVGPRPVGKGSSLFTESPSCNNGTRPWLTPSLHALPKQVCRRTDRFDCVTVEGEKFGRRGNISGGCAPRQESRIAKYKALQDKKDKLARAELQLAEASDKLRCVVERQEQAGNRVAELDNERTQVGRAGRTGLTTSVWSKTGAEA